MAAQPPFHPGHDGRASARKRTASSRHDRLRGARLRLARTCRRQFGVFTLQQAAAAGVARSTVYTGVELGIFLKLWPGVFAVAAAPDCRERRWIAAQLLLGRDAALSHRTAAEIHGLEPRLPDDGIHLTVSMRRPKTRPGIVVHRSSTLHDDGVVGVGALRTTSTARTLCDLAAALDADALRRLVAAAVRAGSTTPALLRQTLARRQHFPGRGTLRVVVDELSPLETMSRSELESLFLRITSRAGIPPTAMNMRVVDAEGVTRWLDAVYLPEGVLIELDSREHHGTLLDWHDDLRRENTLTLVGYPIGLRFSYADLREHPDEVVATIRRALAIARENTRRHAYRGSSRAGRADR